MSNIEKRENTTVNNENQPENSDEETSSLIETSSEIRRDQDEQQKTGAGSSKDYTTGEKSQPKKTPPILKTKEEAEKVKPKILVRGDQVSKKKKKKKSLKDRGTKKSQKDKTNYFHPNRLPYQQSLEQLKKVRNQTSELANHVGATSLAVLEQEIYTHIRHKGSDLYHHKKRATARLILLDVPIGVKPDAKNIEEVLKGKFKHHLDDLVNKKRDADTIRSTKTTKDKLRREKWKQAKEHAKAVENTIREALTLELYQEHRNAIETIREGYRYWNKDVLTKVKDHNLAEVLKELNKTSANDTQLRLNLRAQSVLNVDEITEPVGPPPKRGRGTTTAGCLKHEAEEDWSDQRKVVTENTPYQEDELWVTNESDKVYQHLPKVLEIVDKTVKEHQ